MKPQSSVTLLLAVHRLQEASKREPWQARVLGTENQHVKRISTIKTSGGCKEELDKGVDPRSAAEKMEMGQKASSLGIWVHCLPQAREIQCCFGWQAM